MTQESVEFKSLVVKSSRVFQVAVSTFIWFEGYFACSRTHFLCSHTTSKEGSCAGVDHSAEAVRRGFQKSRRLIPINTDRDWPHAQCIIIAIIHIQSTDGPTASERRRQKDPPRCIEDETRSFESLYIATLESFAPKCEGELLKGQRGGSRAHEG